MIAIEVKDVGTRELVEAMRRAGDDWPNVAKSAMVEAVEFGQMATQENIRAADLLFRRMLLNSIATQVLSEGSPATGYTTKGHVYSELPYAEVMEDGRRPGKFPPRDAIEPWVAEKVMGGALGRAPKGTPEAQVRSLTFLISRSIARKGIEGRKFFAFAMARVKVGMPRFVDRALDDFLARWRS